MKLLTFLLFIFIQVSLNANDLTSIKNIDEAKHNIDAWKRNPYFDATKYESDFQSQLHERIGLAPEFVLKTLGEWDNRSYKSYTLSKNELQVMKK